MAYPAMLRFLPAGFLGLMIAGMLASYRSTIETHLNWGTSYLVHDFYRRFLNRGATERHYVFVGRVTTALLMVCAALLTFALATAKESFDLILSVGAGTGLITRSRPSLVGRSPSANTSRTTGHALLFTSRTPCSRSGRSPPAGSPYC